MQTKKGLAPTQVDLVPSSGLQPMLADTVRCKLAQPSSGWEDHAPSMKPPCLATGATLSAGHVSMACSGRVSNVTIWKMFMDSDLHSCHICENDRRTWPLANSRLSMLMSPQQVGAGVCVCVCVCAPRRVLLLEDSLSATASIGTKSLSFFVD